MVILYHFIVLKKIKMLELMMDNFNKKINELENKINNLMIKIGELEEKLKYQQQHSKKDDNKPIDSNIDKLNDELEKIKKALEELKQAHDQTVIKVSNNKEQIDIILGRLNDIINGYKEGDEKLQNEIDELNKKLAQINSQLDLLLKLPKSTGGDADLSALNELMKKIIDLENDFKLFVEKVNIDEIYRQLKFLNETKADKKDVEDKYDDHQNQIDAINKRLDGIISQLLNRKNDGFEQPNIDIDFSHYVTKNDFEKHKKENDIEFKKIWDELKNLKDLINKIFGILNNKANLSDLEDLKNFLLSKLEELAMACNKKFADKNDTANNLKYLEDQIKKILELLSAKKDTNNEADNWLLAKKPISGYSCAACESMIGNLRDDANKFIPWNKLPLRDPGDKLYRMGNGFSKMLQMLNFDSYGNVSLNPNIINEASINSEINKNNINSNNNNSSLNNNLKHQKDFKKRIKSANPKFKINFKENKNKNSHSTYKNGTIEQPKTRNEMLPDIYDISGTQNEDGPKITKVMRKTYKQ
jgi:hypothetical protein